MRECLSALQAAIRESRPVAYCRLIDTRGSTPQKAGAMMLVFADGRQVGTLGGGCVEAEVKRQAIAALGKDRAEVARFQLDHDYGWDDGLICGGRMDVLIQPVNRPEVQKYFELFSKIADRGEGATEVIAFGANPDIETPRSFLFDASEKPIAQFGAAAPDVRMSVDLVPLAQRPKPSTREGVAYLPMLPRCRLVIVGGGHVGKAVADLAATLEFDTVIVDDRDEYIADNRFPHAIERHAGALDQVLPQLTIDHNTYCLIVTRGHNHDQTALYHLANRGARYVGLIGSRRKIKLILDDLAAEQIPAECLAAVYAPVGIDIGSQTVPEIAISIAAELVAHRNLGGKVPGRPSPVVFSGRK